MKNETRPTQAETESADGTRQEPRTLTCDICIAGAGALGLFAAFFLSGKGARVLLVDSRMRMPSPTLGALWPSPNDPPTRALVAHGPELARYLTNLHVQGVELSRSLGTILAADDARAFRYGLEAFERQELEKAVAANLGVTLLEDAVGLGEARTFFAESAGARALRDPVGWRMPLLRAVRASGVQDVCDDVAQLEERTTGVILRTVKGTRIEAEMVIVCAAARTGELLPAFSEVLVPMSDACFLWKRSTPKRGASAELPLEARAALCLRGHNGHVAAVWAPEAGEFPLRVSGPRFLWPGAGAGIALRGAPDARKREAAMDFHRAKTLPLLARALGFSTWEAWRFRAHLAFHSVVYGVDCLPCDELPVAGEFGRWGRVLGAAGFLGTGLGAQITAARGLVDLAEKGASDLLHPQLSPRRFQSG